MKKENLQGFLELDSHRVEPEFLLDYFCETSPEVMFI